MTDPEPAQPAAATTVHVTAVTETRNLKSPPFQPSSEQIQAGLDWEEWLEGIEREFRFFKINDPEDKKDAMIIYGGREIARLERSLPNPTDGNSYEKLRKKLNDYFTPKKNKHHARYNFLKMRPNDNESTNAYAARLREKAALCEFNDTDERILEHIIQTIDNTSLIQKTINKSWSLEQMMTEAAQMEDTVMQLKDMRGDYEKKINKLWQNAPQQSTWREGDHVRNDPRRGKSGPPGGGLRGAHRGDSSLAPCNYCGRRHM